MTSAETERLRKLLNVPEINYSTALPGWVRASVKELIERGILPQGDGRATNGTVLESLRHATATFGAGWLDHSGRLEKDGREYLTSEPYVSRMDAKTLHQLEQLCVAADWNYQLSAKSNYLPGETLLITISPKVWDK